MICLCKNALATLPLLKADLSAKLGLPLPPMLLELAALPGLPNLGMIAKADLAAMAALALPPFPLSLQLAANVKATLAAAAQLGHLGIPLGASSVQASADLQGLMMSLALHLPGLRIPVPSLELKAIARLAGAMTAIRLSLGIDLFLPGAFLQLQEMLSGALKLQLGLPIDPRLVSNLAAYASLAETLGLVGGIGNLLPAIRFMFGLKLPGLQVDMGPAANLLALLGMLASIKAAFGIDLAIPGAMLALRAKVGTLLSLLPLKLDLNAKLDLLVALGSILPHLSLLAGLSASLQTHLGLLVGLPWPNLGPITLAATLGSQSKLALRIPCPGGCALH
jgi:hypothetical protein